MGTGAAYELPTFEGLHARPCCSFGERSPSTQKRARERERISCSLSSQHPNTDEEFDGLPQHMSRIRRLRGQWREAHIGNAQKP